MITLTEKDISTRASNLSVSTQANGRMSFGTRRIKYIKVFTHWVQDLYRISVLPSIVGLSEVTFKPQLDRAYTRADIRKSMTNQTNSSADAASLGPLENENSGNIGNKSFSIILDITSEQTAYHYHTSYVRMRSQISTVNIRTLYIKQWLA